MVNPASMIAFHFPPQRGSSGIQRTLKFAQYLPAFGWQPLLLSAHPRAYDATSSDQLPEIVQGTVVKRAFALSASGDLVDLPDCHRAPDRACLAAPDRPAMAGRHARSDDRRRLSGARRQDFIARLRAGNAPLASDAMLALHSRKAHAGALALLLDELAANGAGSGQHRWEHQHKRMMHNCV